MPTLNDVAKRAGVSTSSASRAFRDGASISPKLRKKVLNAAKELGYTSNLLARSLKNSKSNLIGLDICELENPFYSFIIKGMEKELKNNGYQLILSYSNGDYEMERKNLELFAGSQTMGIAFIPGTMENRDLVEQLSAKGISMIQLFNHVYDFVDTVAIKDDSGAYQATKYLLEKGHRRILLLNPVTSFSSDRAEGYRKAMHEAGVDVDENLIALFQTTHESQYTIQQLIEQQKPTAVIAGVYNLGINVVRACRQLNLKIHKDISLITFDDVEWPELMDITSVCQPMEYIGQSAARILLDRINGRIDSNHPVLTIVEPKLNIRNSVREISLPVRADTQDNTHER